MGVDKNKHDFKMSSQFKRFLCKEGTAGYVFAAPFIIGFLGFTIIPILYSLYYSFTNYNLMDQESIIWFENYKRLMMDKRFWKSMGVTLRYVLMSVPLKLAFALFVAVLLTRKTKLQGLYRSLYYVPSLIGGSVAVVLVWKEIFSRQGLVNRLMQLMGLPKISWFGDMKLAAVPLVLMSVWQFGSSMIIFAAGLKQVPDTYYDAAKIDGAGRIKTFFHITIPCISPVILYNLVMQTISAFMVFTQAYVITKGGPNDATNFYALYIYKHAFDYRDMGYASAMSWVMLVVISIITYIIFRTSKYWVFSEADEG